jgi:hypothetical protein
MTDEIWDSPHELVPTTQSIEYVTTRAFRTVVERAAATREIEHDVRAQVRVHKPRWLRIQDTSAFATSGSAANYFQVRLGFEFDLAEEARRAGACFVLARCEAFLWGIGASPRVYDLFPRDLYEGESRVVSVELGPELKVGEVSGSLGKISTDLRIGQIEPVIVGWFGAGEREPRWELRPREKTLIGIRNVWLWIEVPRECQRARLAVRVSGDVQTRFGPIPVGLKEVWDRDKWSVVIR